MYLFWHIEKCGGTTAHDYLSNKINNLETFILQNIVQRFFCNRNAKKLKRGF